MINWIEENSLWAIAACSISQHTVVRSLWNPRPKVPFFWGKFQTEILGRGGASRAHWRFHGRFPQEWTDFQFISPYTYIGRHEVKADEGLASCYIPVTKSMTSLTLSTQQNIVVSWLFLPVPYKERVMFVWPSEVTTFDHALKLFSSKWPPCHRLHIRTVVGSST